MISIAYPVLEKEEQKAVEKVMTSGNLSQGEITEKFEKKFSSYTGTKYGIAVSSGTSALMIALNSIGVKGYDVITTPLTFIATSNSILFNGGRPIFCDIDPDTFNINPEKIEEKISEKTKAVVIVHLYGNPCNMDAIKDICEDRGIWLIEDCAQACGAEYKGRKVGSFGDVSCFSFYPTKNITTGEGGMITTNNEEIEKKSRMLRSHGMENGNCKMLGFNFRMTEIQAAIGLSQLKKIEKINDKRRKNAKILTENLTEKIIKPSERKHTKHAWNVYTIRTKEDLRNSLFRHIRSSGIEANIYYKKPVYKEPFYMRMRISGNCKEAEKAAKTVVSLPVHHRLLKKDIEKIIKTVNVFYEN